MNPIVDGIKPSDIIDADAIDLLAERLRTALQIEMHLTLAFEHAFRLGEKRVGRSRRAGAVACDR